MAPKILDVGKREKIAIESSKWGLVMSAAALPVSLPAVVLMVRYIGLREIQTARHLLIAHNRIHLSTTQYVHSQQLPLAAVVKGEVDPALLLIPMPKARGDATGITKNYQPQTTSLPVIDASVEYRGALCMVLDTDPGLHKPVKSQSAR